MQIPDDFRRCVVFLYASGTGSSSRPVGTAFFVTIDRQDGSRDARRTYLVTAKHIVEGAYRAGLEPQARVNVRGPMERALWAESLVELARREDAGEKADIITVFEQLRENPPVSVLELAATIAKVEPLEGAQFLELGSVHEWVFHEDTNVDIAILEWQVPRDVDFWPFPLKDAVTPELIVREGIGLGYDVFVVGLFTRRAGQARNIPIVRVGNIVAMPEEQIKTGTGPQEAYLIELLSIGGLSGSPVFLYLGGLRREFQADGEIKVTAYAGAIHMLGLLHGHWDLGSRR